MKNIIFVAFAFVTLLSAHGQVEFKQVESSEDMDQVWADAAEQNMSVFVDIYATWCGPCKWLDANVFALQEAGSYMNKTFINVKMDGESNFGRAFALQNGLSAYPSLFVFNSEKKLMNKLVGAKPWEELEPELVSTLEYFPVLEVMQQKYSSSLLKKEEYPRYVTALREMGKAENGYEVAANYSSTYISENTWSENDIQVMAFFTEPGTDSWNILTSDIDKLRNALGKDLESFIDYATTSVIEQAVEDNDPDLIVSFSAILEDLVEGTGEDAIELETRCYVYYYHYTGQLEALMEYIDKEYESSHQGDHEWLFNAASNAVLLDPGKKEVAQKGIDWFNECIKQKETHDYYYHLALCYYFIEDPEKTIELLKKSLEHTEDQEIITTTLSIIERVKEDL